MHDLIEKVLDGTGIPLYRDFQDEKETENYAVWNFADNRGGNYVDDVPTTDDVAIQLHWFVNCNTQIDDMCAMIRRRFLNLEFTYPDLTILYEETTKLRHIIFSTEKTIERT